MSNDLCIGNVGKKENGIVAVTAYGFRTWIEYGLNQSKDALGWADFRITSYDQIEKWWEMVMSAFLMVSLFAEVFNDSCPLAHQHSVQHP